MAEYFDKEGRPISFEEWMNLFEDMDYRRVAATEVPRGHVSTVWLGLNHAFGGGPPLIFESMAFPGGKQERYSTLQEALAGHEAMVLAARERK